MPRISDYQQYEWLFGRNAPDIGPPPIWPAVRAIVGLVALLTVAYLGGHSRVKAIERRLNIAHLMTTGLPFAALGFLASLPAVGILTPAAFRGIAPLLPLGLGWIGFVIGSRFDARALERLPSGTGRAALLTTGISVALVMATGGWTISLLHGHALDREMVRDALLLAIAGAMAGRIAPEFLRAALPLQAAQERLAGIIGQEQLLGIFGMLLISISYRPPGEAVAWQLPAVAWLFITLGIGTAIGALLYAAFSRIHKGPQFAALLLGSAAFASGIASYLRISTLSVCFISGAIMSNLGGRWKDDVVEVFSHLERPIYFLFMIIAGAMWHPWEWQGWVLMVLFVVTRFAANFGSARLLRRWGAPVLEPAEQRALSLAPMGVLSVAIVISAQDLYSGPTIPWIVTTVIVGSLVTETVLQLAFRREAQIVPAPAAMPSGDQLESPCNSSSSLPSLD